MIVLIIIAMLLVLIAAGFWYGLRGAPNSGPALGNNSPYPSTMSGEEPPYWPTPLISPDEEFRRSAGSRLSRARRRIRSRRP